MENRSHIFIIGLATESLGAGQLGAWTEDARNVALQGGVLAGVAVTSLADCGGGLACLAGLSGGAPEYESDTGEDTAEHG